MTRPRRAAITGLGAISGFGAGAELLFTSLEAGRRAVSHHQRLAAAQLPSVAAIVPGSDPLAPGDRATGFALAAVREAVRDAAGVEGGDGLSVCVGTTLGAIGAWLDVVRGVKSGDSRPAVAAPSEQSASAPATADWTWSGPASAIAAAHNARGSVITTSVACASGNAALGAALDEIRAGRATRVIAGGVDSLSDFVLAGFGALKAADASFCRPFDRTRSGLNLGEGACFLVLEDEAFARARGARIRAFLDGFGEANDAHHMTGPDPEGRGAARALSAALTDAGCTPDEVDFVSAHGTATIFNDLMEAKALHLALGPRASSVPLNSIKGSLGHTLGAAGAFEALLCVRSLETGLVVPTSGFVERDPAIDLAVVSGASRSIPLQVALSGSSGFGGVNAALLFRAAR